MRGHSPPHSVIVIRVQSAPGVPKKAVQQRATGSVSHIPGAGASRQVQDSGSKQPWTNDRRRFGRAYAEPNQVGSGNNDLMNPSFEAAAASVARHGLDVMARRLAGSAGLLPLMSRGQAQPSARLPACNAASASALAAMRHARWPAQIGNALAG